MTLIASNAETLWTRVRACTLCVDLPLGPRPIFQADPRARILIASQAPGRRAHGSGVPFDDPSGERLRGWLGVDAATFYDPARFAIVPVGLCYPGKGASGDLPPVRACARQWRAAMLAELPEIALTVVVGHHAAAWHVPGFSGSLTALVQRGLDAGSGLIVLPHPSPRNNGWFKANPWFDAEIVPALRAAVQAASG
ncbi:MAG: uracil-DNA glycosylase family protein [Proteobacteria bacterium]|nr:uracil-DNA glycosylase family protein [Pseudomonadota bacterium]